MTPAYPVTLPSKDSGGFDYSILSDADIEKVANGQPGLKPDEIKALITRLKAEKAAANGKPGGGVGTKIYVPGPNAKLEYGTYDAKGVMQPTPFVMVLAHELAHAWLLSRGKESLLATTSPLRPGHDLAINLENTMR